MAKKRGRPKQRLFQCVKECYINETSKHFEAGDYARIEQLGSHIPKHFIELDPVSHAIIQEFGDEEESQEEEVQEEESQEEDEPF